MRRKLASGLLNYESTPMIAAWRLALAAVLAIGTALVPLPAAAAASSGPAAPGVTEHAGEPLTTTPQ